MKKVILFLLLLAFILKDVLFTILDRVVNRKKADTDLYMVFNWNMRKMEDVWNEFLSKAIKISK